MIMLFPNWIMDSNLRYGLAIPVTNVCEAFDAAAADASEQ